MRTFSKIYIKSERISEVLNELKKYYTIERIGIIQKMVVKL